jgi:hypothetical protein
MYTVFDGVAKFQADTSALDQFIVKLEQGLSTASEKAAASTRDLKTAQQEFKASIQAVSAESGDTTANLQRLAQAEKELTLAAAAAKTEHVALKEQLLGTAEASSVAGEATAGLTGKLASMFGILAVAEGLKSLITGTQQSLVQLKLLSETTGINVTTLAGLEEVTKRTGVSFDAVSTALKLMVRAQTLAIETHKQQADAFKRIGISVDELKALKPEDLFYRVSDGLTHAKNSGDQLASAQAILGRGGKELIPIFMEQGKQLRVVVDEAGRLSGVTDEAADAAANLEAMEAKLSATLRADAIPVMEASLPLLRGIASGAKFVQEAFLDVATVIVGTGMVFKDQVVGMGTIMNDVVHGNLSKAAADAKVISSTMTSDFAFMGTNLKKNFQDSADFAANVYKDVQPFKPLEQQQTDFINKGKDLTFAAKAELAQQLADIKDWEAGQHLAFTSGQIDAAAWAAAQVHAADAADAAREKSLQKQIAIYTQAGQTEKAHAAAIEFSATKTEDAAKENEKLAAAMEKHRQEVLKLSQAYGALQTAGVIKEWDAAQKAAENLAKAESQLTLAQTALGESMVSRAFKEQESAITQLAQFHLISERQKREQLLALYAQEEADALSILQKQLAEQKALMDAAQQKVTAAQGNPFFTDAQILDLKKNLALAETAYTKTQTEITKTEEKFDKEREAQQKGSIAKAIAQITAYQSAQLRANEAQLQAIELEIRLAQARGQDTSSLTAQRTALLQQIADEQKHETAQKQQLSLDLQLHQAQLTAVKDEIAIVQAEGKDTTALKTKQKAIEDQTKAIIKQTQALTKEAQEMGRLRTAWDMFSSDFSAKAKESESVASEMAQSFSTAVQGLETGIQSAFAAMVDGTTSAGKAMEAAVFKTIGSIAEQWGAYYIARGIADVFDDPPAAAAEFAAGAALEALGGALSGLSSLVSSTSTKSTGSSTGSSSTSSSTSAATAAQPQPVQTTNVQSFASGGLASMPMMAMIGDSEHGGAAQEAVIPLENQRALDTIAAALVPPLLRAMGTSRRNQEAAAMVPSFAEGGLVSMPMFAKVGDAPGGGAATEGILPLDDSRAMTQIAQAIVSHLVMPPQRRYEGAATSALLPASTLAAAGAAGAAAAVPFSVQRSEQYEPSAATKERDAQQIANALAKALDGKTPLSGKIEIELKSDIPALVKRINHHVNLGDVRLLASNSIRYTPRS